MSVRTLSLKFPLYTIEPKNRIKGEELPIGTWLDLSTGEYLGLLFTHEMEAKRFMHINGLNKHEIKSFNSISTLVLLARKLLKDDVIKSIVFDYAAAVDTPVTCVIVKDLANTNIPEDNIHDHG